MTWNDKKFGQYYNNGHLLAKSMTIKTFVNSQLARFALLNISYSSRFVFVPNVKTVPGLSLRKMRREKNDLIKTTNRA